MDDKLEKILKIQGIEQQKKLVEKVSELVEVLSKEKTDKTEIIGAELVTIKGDKGDKGEKGDKGNDGKDADEELIVEKVQKKIKIPKDGKDGRDGKDGIDGIGKDGKNGLDGKDGRDGSPDTPEQIAQKINTLNGVIEFSVLKDFEIFKLDKKLIDQDNLDRAIEILDRRTQYLVNKNKITGLISAGTNINITGQGTSDSPYVISSTGGGSGWLLAGNAGTTPGTDFLGTTDAKDLVVKTNNTERMRVTSAGNYTFTGSSIIVTGGSQWDWWGDGSTTYVTMGSINADSYFRLRSGTGGVTLYSPSHVAIEAGAPLRFYNAADSQYVALQAGTLASDTTYTLPTAYPASNGYALVSTTAGVMSWAAMSGGSGSATTYSVTQTAHGFSVGDVIKSAGTANAYAKAQANSAANAEVVGIVTVVTDADNFTYTTEGVITTGVPVATAGTTYFLSPSSAGAMTATEPTTVGQVSKPLLIVLESGAKAVFAFSIRGEVIGTVAGLAGSTGITVDGGGGVITTGVKGYISIPYSGTITGWTIFSDVSGSCVIDTWKDTYANFPPTVADTIWGGSKPTLSSAQKNQATGLSIAVTQGDVFAYNVDSATTVTRVNLTINITKS